MTQPTKGGVYQRDPISGELTMIEEPTPSAADSPEANAADEPDAAKTSSKPLRKDR